MGKYIHISIHFCLGVFFAFAVNTEIGGKFQEAVLIILCSKNIFSLASHFAGIQLFGLIILNDVSMILDGLNGLEKI